jgi:BirA family transcriptional regulator, biotin operon repressor / biotin---[acetyl-CoA-carboxylase] ligase
MKQSLSWLHWVETCPSTNTWARDRALQLQHGDVVFTQRQTAGRGQHKRVWHAPPGVLTASFMLDGIPAAQFPGLSLAAGLAVIQAVEALVGSLRGQLRLKWSNDVFLNGGKLAGILCEASTRATPVATHPTRVIVGVGLNLRAEFAADPAEAALPTLVGHPISLHQLAPPPEELVLLAELRQALLKVARLLSDSQLPPAQSGLAPLLPALAERDLLRDRPITLEHNGRSVRGRAVGFDAWGRLLLQGCEGKVTAFSSGRVIMTTLG